MVGLQIRGVAVDFPFRPYECQLLYMEKVIEALQTGQNALLESPTGTGKTLCLLCATLAWQSTFEALNSARRLEASRAGGGPVKTEADAARQVTLRSLEAAVGVEAHRPQTMNPAGAAADAPGAVNVRGLGTYTYAAKPPPAPESTMKEQIRAVQEAAGVGNGLGATGSPTRPPTIIYASRTHSQLAQVVAELRRTSYRPKTIVLGSRQQLCIHPTVSKLTGSKQNRACRNLVADHAYVCGCVNGMGMTRRCRCAYKNALEIQKLETTAGTEIRDIEDLAKFASDHRACPFYLSREVAAKEANIIFVPYNYLIDPTVAKGVDIPWQGSIVIVDEAHNLENVCCASSSFDLSSTDIAGCMDECDICLREVQRAPTDCNFMPDDVIKFKVILKEMEDYMDECAKQTGAASTHPGAFILHFFERFNIRWATAEVFLDTIERFVAVVAIAEPHRSVFRLERLAEAVRTILGDPTTVREQWLERAQRFKVHFHKEPIVMTRQDGRPAGPTQYMQLMSYWCFSPSVAVEELMKRGVRNMLLTSGTLSPLDSFASELLQPFPIRLENSHIVTGDQVLVSLVAKGVTGKALNSSYQVRDTPEYKAELGNTLVNFAKIVPDGMLVFFPSYVVMASCIKFWQQNETWKRLSNYKPVFVEPRLTTELVSITRSYAEAVNSGQGGLLFAVCRGKISEGIDFPDRLARAVVVTGIPYPPKHDARVTLKQTVQDEQCRLPPKFPGMKAISGSEWYSQQATRAVNQAIGRVIRHRFDYGAVLLCDERFASNRNGLSQWLRPYFDSENRPYGEVNAKLGRFFRTVPSMISALTAANATVSAASSSVFGMDIAEPAATAGGISIVDPDLVPEISVMRVVANESGGLDMSFVKVDAGTVDLDDPARVEAANRFRERRRREQRAMTSMSLSAVFGAGAAAGGPTAPSDIPDMDPTARRLEPMHAPASAHVSIAMPKMSVLMPAPQLELPITSLDAPEERPASMSNQQFIARVKEVFSPPEYATFKDGLQQLQQVRAAGGRGSVGPLLLHIASLFQAHESYDLLAEFGRFVPPSYDCGFPHVQCHDSVVHRHRSILDRFAKPVAPLTGSEDAEEGPRRDRSAPSSRTSTPVKSAVVSIVKRERPDMKPAIPLAAMLSSAPAPAPAPVPAQTTCVVATADESMSVQPVTAAADLERARLKAQAAITTAKTVLNAEQYQTYRKLLHRFADPQRQIELLQSDVKDMESLCLPTPESRELFRSTVAFVTRKDVLALCEPVLLRYTNIERMYRKRQVEVAATKSAEEAARAEVAKKAADARTKEAAAASLQRRSSVAAVSSSAFEMPAEGLSRRAQSMVLSSLQHSLVSSVRKAPHVSELLSIRATNRAVDEKAGPSRTIECVVCNTSDNLNSVSCGHVCCFDCWTKLLKSTGCCPMCRQKIDAASMTRLFF